MAATRSRWRRWAVVLAGLGVASWLGLIAVKRLPSRDVAAPLHYFGSPTWSADGRYAAVLGWAGGDLRVALLEVSQGGPRTVRVQDVPVPSPPSTYAASVWHPEVGGNPAIDASGKTLYYSVIRNPDGIPDLLAMDLDTGETTELGPGASPLPDPTGSAVAYQTITDEPAQLPTYVLRDDGSKVRATFGFTAYSTLIAWSPHGARIACIGREAVPSGFVSGTLQPSPRMSVLVVSLGGPAPTQALVPSDGEEGYLGVGWEDDDTLLMAIARGDASNQTVFGICSYDLKTGTRRQVVSFGRLELAFPRVWFSSDGGSVFWQDPGDGSRKYYTADLATCHPMPLVFPEEVRAVPSPDGTSVLAVGRTSGSLYWAHRHSAAAPWSLRRVASGSSHACAGA